SIDSGFGLLAVHVCFELNKIESDSSRVRFKQFTRIWRFAPGVLFSIQHVVHLPTTALQPRCFCSDGGLAGMLVRLQPKIPTDYTQTRIVLFFELASTCREHPARRRLQTLVAL